MNAPPETHDVEVIKRFLLRFADLMSNGSNSANLLLAAQLLEANVNRANDAEEQLRQERSNCVNLTAQLAALSSDSHVLAPISILRLATSQFKPLARALEKSGDAISQAMCEASAATLKASLKPKRPETKS
jgi:AcrR family transcriptional regulator